MPKSTPNYTSIERAAEAYAKVADTRSAILSQCEIAWGYMHNVPDAEVSEARKNLSLATMRALAERYGIPTDGPAFEEAAKIAANKPGGIGVSTTAIKQRTNAYAHVLAAGLTPDILNVTAAFRLHSITAEGHAEIVQRVTSATLEGGDFVKLANEESDTLTAIRKQKRGARGAGGGGGTTPVITPQNVIAALTWASANVDAFSDEEVQQTLDALAQLSAFLEDRKVPANA
jgi:hypothetical protein